MSRQADESGAGKAKGRALGTQSSKRTRGVVPGWGTPADDHRGGAHAGGGHHRTEGAQIEWTKRDQAQETCKSGRAGRARRPMGTDYHRDEGLQAEPQEPEQKQGTRHRKASPLGAQGGRAG